MTFDPRSVEVTCDSTQGSLWLSPMKIHQSMCIVTFFQKIEPKVIDASMTFDPKSVEVTCVTLPKDHCVQVPWKYIKVDAVPLFFQKLELKVTDPQMTFDLHLIRSHVWLYPRIIVSKSHGNTSKHVDSVINFAKYHIHTTYIPTYGTY